MPKALIEVAGAPFVFHQLGLLKRHGAREIVLCVAHLGQQIEAVVGDGSRLGLQVSYSYDGAAPIGTADAVRKALPALGDVFFVLYGDTYLRIDYAAVERAFRERDAQAMMTVLRNDGRWDTSNAVFDGDRVTEYDKRHPNPEMRWIDYGLGVFKAGALENVAQDANDLADVYCELARSGALAGFEATERFYEIGTPEALAETDRFLRGQAAPSGD